MQEPFYEPHFSSSIKSVINIFNNTFETDHDSSGTINNHYELAYITEGSLHMSINGTVFHLSPYDLYIKRPNDHYNIKVDTSSDLSFMIINFQLNEGILDEVAGKIYHLDTEQRLLLHELDRTFSAAFANSRHRIKPKLPPDTVAERIAFLQFELFLLSLLKTKNNAPSDHILQSTGAHHYKRINDILHQNLGKNLTVPEIASLCNMSVANVKKIMAQYAGCGVIKYFTLLKITTAIHYLKAGYSVTEACGLLGFSSPSYFTQVFKRETGKSPTEYLKS